MVSHENFLEGYERLKTVGKGAFGTAVLYRRLTDNMHVVMKEVFLSDMTKDEKHMALNEVNVLSSLDHPNIIKYIGSFEKEGSLIIIMEYANDGNLAQLISKKKEKKEAFTEKSVLQIVYQISSALTYMHANKILHRDLKTANIFLNKNGMIKIGDFGISKMLTTKVQAQTVVGTPYYLSPEMCEGREYNEKSDIWALGCITYELLCLRRPFEAATLSQLVKKITYCEYEEIPTHYSEGVTQLIHSILQKNIEYRPSAQDIYENIIPDICRNLDNLSDVCRQFSFALNESTSSERSVLYSVIKCDGSQSLFPFELPHRKIIDYSVSKSHYIVITSDNLIYTWGEDSFGQLAHGTQAPYRKFPICAEYLRGKKIFKCAAGNGFSLFLTENGLVLSCGDGRNGCLGHGDWNVLLRPKLIDSLITTNIEQIVCGSNHVLALSYDKTVYVWGLGEDGQLGLGHKQFCCSPTIVKTSNNEITINKIFAGDNASILLTSQGTLFVTGNNSYNKLGVKDKEKITTFTLINDVGHKIKDISIGLHHTILLTENGMIIAMGRNLEGQLGKGNKKTYISPQVISVFDQPILFISSGSYYTLAVTSNNVLYIWGSLNKDSIDKKELNNKNLEIILQPSSLLALYSSPENVKSGNMIWIGDIKTHMDNIFILIHTTAPPPICKEDSTDNQSSNWEPSWKNSLSIPPEKTTLPNTPQPHD